MSAMGGETLDTVREPVAGARGWSGHALVWAALCALLVLAWQALTVHYNYHGNWTALFCTGAKLPVPPALAGERIHRFPGSNGWDGQFYHYIAHDPLLRSGLGSYIEAPRLRYRRILVPALAFALALGDAARIDTAYRLVILAFILLGAWALARLAVTYGRHPAWGLAFFLAPGAIASIDRLAVDAALAALALAFALLVRTGRDGWPLYAVLVAASLARDTGILLTAAYALWLLRQRQITRAILFSTASLPAAAWYAFVIARTAPYVNDGRMALPFTGVLDRFLHPMTYPFAPVVNLVLHSLDYLAAAGVALAFLLAWHAARKSAFNPIGLAVLLFTALGLIIWRPGDWLEAFDYGRILSPLLVFLALGALDRPSWTSLAPLAMVLPRFGLQMLSQVFGVLRGLAG